MLHRTDQHTISETQLNLKLLLKRGALLAAANWPAIAFQFVAETTFQVLLAVPIVSAAILVAVLVGADVGDLLRGGLRDIFTTVAGTLMSAPFALVSFMAAFGMVLIGGSILMFLVKGGTIDVLIAAHASAGPVEVHPLTIAGLRPAAQFTLARFTAGCARLFRPYLALGFALMLVYAASTGTYLAFVIYGDRAAGGFVLLIGWTFVAALATGILIVWITLVNFLYLLMQIAIAVDDVGMADAARAVVRFVRAEYRDIAGVFLVILALVVAATFVSFLAWTGVGLIAFVPLVGLAVFPLQIAALVIRGLAFEYIALASVGTYLTLYTRAPRTFERHPAATVAVDRAG